MRTDDDFERFYLGSRRRRLVRHAAALLRLGRPEDVEPRGVEDVALVDALRTLPVRQRQAVVMHHVAGLEVAQIAAELGVPAGTVKSWLSRGRTALAKALTDDNDAALTEVRASNA
jgi:RNA polymerase sigma-70 factor (ECF subfamily)